MRFIDFIDAMPIFGKQKRIRHRAHKPRRIHETSFYDTLEKKEFYIKELMRRKV